MSSTLDQLLSIVYFRNPRTCRAVEHLAHRYNASAILGVYSDVHALVLAQKASAKLGLPFSVYLHDPIVEGTYGSTTHWYAKRVQAEVFSPKRLFFSMSEGLADLLLQKYGLRTIPLPHCYNETPSPPIVRGGDQGPRSALFSGNIYDINRPAVIRAAKAARRAGYRIVCTNQAAAQAIVRDGIPAESVDVRSLPDRVEYLSLLRDQDVLFAALSWPDESPIHRDSLATIFPTKVPEYLGAGRPVLIHCPVDYALAAFFQKYQCGLVVSERNEDALFNAWRRVRDDNELALELARNAYRTVPYFDGQRIAGVFRQEIEALIKDAERS